MVREEDWNSERELEDLASNLGKVNESNKGFYERAFTSSCS